MMYIKFKGKITDQKGMASFLITIVMTIVITLIVIGFSQIARSEETAALNRQLSSQAFYAAESGINDAIKAIQGYELENAGTSTIISPPNKTTCGTDSTDYPTLTGGVNTSSKVSYPCILISSNPTTLVYTGATSKVLNIQTSANTIVNTISINWQTDSTSNLFTGCNLPVGSFPKSWATTGCGADVLQVDLVPASALASTSPLSQLESNTFVTFLYPSNSGNNTVNDIASNLGVVQASSCSTATGCTANISVNTLDQNQYYLRFYAMYGTPQNVTITARDSNGNQIAFVNGQAIIDSTGIANGVLRRVEVRTEINSLNSGIFPTAAIQSSQSICKKFWITPGPPAVAPGGINQNPGSIIDASGGQCQTT